MSYLTVDSFRLTFRDNFPSAITIAISASRIDCASIVIVWLGIQMVSEIHICHK